MTVWLVVVGAVATVLTMLVLAGFRLWLWLDVLCGSWRRLSQSPSAQRSRSPAMVPGGSSTTRAPDEAHGGFQCVLAFDTDSEDFVRGVEIGRLWERLSTTSEPVTQMVHAGNAEMMLRLAEAQGRQVVGREIDDRWIDVTFT